jgi:Tfp pilus assembly protein PilF
MLLFIGVLVLSFIYTASAQALLQVGQQAPDFALQDIEGKGSVNLSQYGQKKAVVLLFWSTWSSNSSRALKRMEAFYRDNKDAVQVIGINADNQTLSEGDVEGVRKVVRELGITFPVLVDRGLKTFHEFNIIALPSTVVIMEGKIAYELPGLPLVGTEELFDFLLTAAGKQPKTKSVPGYRPLPAAVADTNLARGLIRKGKPEAALALLRKAMEKDPRYMLPYVEAAKLYQMGGKNAEAEDVLRKALAVEPANMVILSELGYHMAKTGKLKESENILSDAGRRDAYPPSQYYFAYALGKDGRLKESLAAFEQSLSLNQYEPAIYLLRAEVYEGNNMFKEASSDYRKALELLMKVKIK